ncbi:MAG TPA: permease [Holophaga sp.]|nr:permease [Holophaga sp.]
MTQEIDPIENNDPGQRPCCCGGACRPAGKPGAGAAFWKKGGWLVLALPLWFLVYHFLQPFANLLTTRVFRLDPASHLGGAVAFFLYDSPKVLMLLGLVVLGVTFIQTFVSPERTRDILARRAGAWGNLLAALLGIITPFCSCSAVPLFIGFVRVGVPLGATFSFLVSAPMVNEVALFMLLGLFGWKIAGIYALTGVVIAFVSGWILGKLKMERHLESWVLEMPFKAQAATDYRMGFPERLETAVQGVREIVGKVWPYILAGIAVGAFIHGYVPESLMARFMGKGAWWSVPLSVLIGVPLYSNAAGVMPIVQALLGKGAALGTVLAFMMAVIGLSLPETIILRKVLKPTLIAVFIGVVATGILVVGYLFNVIL